MKHVLLVLLFLLMIAGSAAAISGCASTQTESQPETAVSEVPVQQSAPLVEEPTPAPTPVVTDSAGTTDKTEQSNAQALPPEGAASAKDAIYFIMVDRFYNAQDNTDDVDLSDPAGWHGGDLEGVRLKLPWLQSLGITKLWLSPIFTAASDKFFDNGAFHGYWTYDLNSIDKHFGTEEDLKKLATDAKQYGIELILDFVVNHVGYGAPLVEQKPQWFHPAVTIEDWNDPTQLTERQVHGLPDLDQSNPEVYAYIMNAAWKWITMPNIAGFRLDAVKHVDLKFWANFNQQLKSGKKDIMLIGEYFDGNPKKVDDIQKSGMFTQMFDFPLTFALRDVFCENRSLANLASIVTNDRQYTSANDMVTFLDNHDMPRFISLCHGNTNAMERALRVLFAWRGIPCIYYGTETPMAGLKEPDNRADMDFERAEFYPLIQSALRLRAQNPVFAKGATRTLVYQPGLVVFAREYKEQQALLVITQEGATQHFKLPPGTWHDAETNRLLSNIVTVKPNSVQILIQNNAPNSIIDQSMKTITFHVPNDGATYAIVGSAPELGQWDPANAPKTNSELSIELPAQTVITYKPIKIDANGGITWADGDNRELFTNTTTSVDVKW